MKVSHKMDMAHRSLDYDDKMKADLQRYSDL